MKLRYESSGVESEGLLRQRNYAIKSDARFMDILSSLYSNPILAIVREYWTNAEDGHVALRRKGQEPPKPIEIHAPTVVEPWYGVRDYGISMDAETAWEVYAIYGESTKNDNNEEVGGLGLGAKAAHAYRKGADQWTVTCVLDGEKRVYVASRDNHGMPTFNEFEVSETDELNGVEIRIPVPTIDMYDFKSAMSKVARHAVEDFVVLGDSAGVEAGKYDREVYKYTSKYAGTAPLHTHAPAVRMGSVSYPLDVEQLGAGFGYVMDKVLFFEVGDLDIAPSREALMYTDHTLDALKARVSLMVQEKLAGLEKLDFTKNFAEQLTKIEEVQGGRLTTTAMDNICRLSDTSLAKKIKDFWEDKVGMYGPSVRLGHLVTEDSEKEFLKKWEVRSYAISDVYKRSLTPVQTDEAENAFLHHGGDTRHFFVADMRKGVSVVKKAVREGKGGVGQNKFSVFTWKEKQGVPTKEDVKALQELFRGHPSVLATEIHDQYPHLFDPKNKSFYGPTEKAPAQLWRFTGTGWREEDVDLTDGGYWVEFSYRKYSDDNKWRSRTGDFATLMDVLKIYGSYDPSTHLIYGIPKSRLKEIEGNEDWEHAEEAFDDELTKILETQKLTEVREVPNDCWDNQSSLLRVTSQIKAREDLDEKTRGLFEEWYSTLKPILNGGKSQESYKKQSVNAFIKRWRDNQGKPDAQIHPTYTPEAERIIELEKEIDEKYPLFSKLWGQMYYYANSSSADTLVAYLQDRDDLARLKELEATVAPTQDGVN